MKTNLDQQMSSSTDQIHSLITPADIRAGEPVKAYVKVQGSFQETRVWRISPLGVEFLKSPALGEVKVGDSLGIELSIGKEKTTHSGVIVSAVYEDDRRSIVGVRFYQNEEENWIDGSERRSSKRWSCSSEFLPNGVAPNPGKFNDFIFFKLIDVSSNGCRIETSLRNKFLVPGMKLNTTITFPVIGNVNIRLKVKNAALIEKSGKDFLSLGCSFSDPSKTFHQILAQYVFQFGSASSIKELKDEGLIVQHISKGIEFKYVRTKDEYQQVLNLRQLSYSASGKLAAEASTADIYDARSRIIIGVYKGEVIASTRLIFNEMDDAMEHEQFVTFDSRAPRRDEICEITRVCTHPDFRGSDLLSGLLRYVAITVAQSGRRYILGCATDELLPLYLRIGFNSLNLIFYHKDLNNLKHTIFLCDVHEVAVGKGVSPLAWNILWRDVVKYIGDYKLIQFDNVANTRIGFYRLFYPLALLAMSIRIKRKKPSRPINNMLQSKAPTRKTK